MRSPKATATAAGRRVSPRSPTTKRGGRPGPLVRGAVFRRNRCDNNASIDIGGLVADVLVEHCTVQHSDRGILVARASSRCCPARELLDDVAQPIVDEGSRALVISQR